jgi:ubiquinone/menaquinone biosynthesis C-methylase UbiE
MTDQISFKTHPASVPEDYERHFVPAVARPLAEELVEQAAPQPGERVLDVACGTGVVTRLAAARVGAAGRVTGVDINPGMLAVARAGAPGPARVEWIEGSAERLPVPDESYDVALCSLGMPFVADRRAALAQLRRVLVAGGRTVFNAPGPTPDVFGVLHDALARHVGAEAATFIHGVFSLHDPDQLRQDLYDAGFRDVGVDAATKTLLLPAPGEFLWQYLSSTPLAAAGAAIEDDQRVALEHDVLAGWQPMTADGRLVLRVRLVSASARR